MSHTHDVERARRMLTEQLEALGSLRNANTRDPNFKQWRQNTLTAIQRIWPGDPTRGERFRRVPFSAPSSRAEARQVRECYERGCAEAAAYLRSLLAEIELLGVPGAEDMARPASLEPGVAEDDFPTVDLPGGPPRPGPSPAAPPPAASASPPAPDRPVYELPELTPPEPVEAPKAHAPRPASGKASTRGAKNGRRNGHKPRLKDMLGFGDDEAAAESDAPPASSAEMPPAPECPPAPPPSGRVPTPAPAPHERPHERDSAAAEADVERAMEDFLRMSPVFSSQARPVRRKLPPGTGPFTAPAALALAALAADIEALEVPDGHRARARATLLELARHMDSHDLTWEALRDGVNFAMEFPAIGRRVLPLLVPYLDQAA